MWQWLSIKSTQPEGRVSTTGTGWLVAAMSVVLVGRWSGSGAGGGGSIACLTTALRRDFWFRAGVAVHHATLDRLVDLAEGCVQAGANHDPGFIIRLLVVGRYRREAALHQRAHRRFVGAVEQPVALGNLDAFLRRLVIGHRQFWRWNRRLFILTAALAPPILGPGSSLNLAFLSLAVAPTSPLTVPALHDLAQAGQRLEAIAARTSNPESEAGHPRAWRPSWRQVRLEGDGALLELSERFDGVRPDPLRIPSQDLAAAWEQCPLDLQEALKLAHPAHSRFPPAPEAPGHQRQRACMANGSDAAGGPVDRAGLYIPGGRAAYPSTVLMNAVPARVAGVERLVMVTTAGR